MRSILRALMRPLLRFAFHLFYNPFAFTYDTVSALVSHGEWRAWTRAAMPRIQGKRVLEVPCGTGNLLLDLSAAGYAATGVDLSPWMIRITRGKLRSAKAHAGLVRARVQTLPFPSRAFDSAVMTFPPGFAYEPGALREIHRVLAANGRLIWVDAGRLLPNTPWHRFLNFAFRVVDGGEQDFGHLATAVLTQAGFNPRLEWVRNEISVVAVITGYKGGTVG